MARDFILSFEGWVEFLNFFYGPSKNGSSPCGLCNGNLILNGDQIEHVNSHITRGLGVLDNGLD